MLLSMDGSEAPDSLDENQKAQIARRLRLARRRAGLKQNEVGVHLGIAGSTMSRLETGQGNLRRWLLLQLSELYQVELDWLVHGTGPEPGDLAPELPPSRIQGDPEPPTHVLQYRICPTCGQEGIPEGLLISHLSSGACTEQVEPTAAARIAETAEVDPAPWVFKVDQLTAKLKKANTYRDGTREARAHWNTVKRIMERTLKQVEEIGPENYKIRRPEQDDPYLIARQSRVDGSRNRLEDL